MEVELNRSMDTVIDNGSIEVQANIYSLKILVLINEMHAKHGLRHNDFQRYRGYCSRRLLRIRKVLHMVQGERKKYTKKNVSLDVLLDSKFLQIPLLTAERAWAYAMQLKFEMNTEPRKKFHMIGRLRKSRKYAEILEKLCMECDNCDARTKLEAQAYHSWIRGIFQFERQKWRLSLASLTAAQTIYDKLTNALESTDLANEAIIYKTKLDEIFPSLRYCAYNIGDDVDAKTDLLNMRGRGGTDLDDLINQTLEQQASTLQEIEWKGRLIPVKHETIRLFLLREQAFPDDLLKSTNIVSSYDSLLMECKNAIECLRVELNEDPTFRTRKGEGPVSNTHFLYTYLMYIRFNRTIERNLVMVASMKEILEGKRSQIEGKKPIKSQDLVRLYETIIQQIKELPLLAGLEDDALLKRQVDAKVMFYRAARCNQIAQSLMSLKKWSESMAVFEHATNLALAVKGNSDLDASFEVEIEDLLSSIESRRFMAHANSILDLEESKQTVSDEITDEIRKLPLIERLDFYITDDNSLVTGKPNLVRFPPSFEPVPCKPWFFDLAHEHIKFPSLDKKLNIMDSGSATKTTKDSWLGGWLGWNRSK